MATTTENKAKAFAEDLAALMEAHEAMLHIDHQGNLLVCHFGGDEVMIGRRGPANFPISVTALRLRKAIESAGSE